MSALFTWMDAAMLLRPVCKAQAVWSNYTNLQFRMGPAAEWARLGVPDALLEAAWDTCTRNLQDKG